MTASIDALSSLERVVADPLRFKQRLRIGEDAYALRRLSKLGWQWWDAAGAASTGANVAKSAAVASTFFAPAAPTGMLAWLGLATPAASVTPVGWVIAAALLAGGGYYGVTRWWASQPDRAVDVIPRFINTPLDELATGVFDVAGTLALCVAAADGDIAPAERAAILGHFTGDWGFDAAFADAALALLEAETDVMAAEATARRMARFLHDNPDCNSAEMQAELLAFLRDLMLADGRVEPAEQDVVRTIETAFAAEGRWSLATASSLARTTTATAWSAAGDLVQSATSNAAAAMGAARELAARRLGRTN